MSGKRRLVVVGNGMAGARAVEEILTRGGGEQFAIAMFGDEPYGNYNRILLSHVLTGEQDPDEIVLNPIEWYAENGIMLHSGVRVVEIDRPGKAVFCDNALWLHYDQLVIATGSRPFMPPLEGLVGRDGRYKPGIFVFRTLDDCRHIAAAAQSSGRAAVIGGGLLGLEAARGVLGYSCEVHVIELGPYLMTQQLDAPAGAILKSTMEAMGVHVQLGKKSTAVLGEGRVEGLAFADGGTLPCDMVVIAAGIVPNRELGVRSGLTVERAIVVDDHMRSVDDPDIYVVGECAQHRGRVYGLVAPLWEQARVLADHITGRDTGAAYHGSKLGTKLKVMGVELASMGTVEAEASDEVVQFSEPRRGVYKKLIVREGRLTGAILLGDMSKAAFLTQAFERDLPLPEARRELLFDIAAPSGPSTFQDMADALQICNCNGVAKGDIGRSVRAGARTARAVMEATRAGLGCGSCKGMVDELVAWFCEGQVEEDPSVHYYVPGIPMPTPELVRSIRERSLRSVSRVFEVLTGGVEDATSKPGLASLLRTIWGRDYEDERDARFINERVHANIQKDGTFSVIPQIPGGVTTPAQLKRIAEVAERYRVPLVKITGGQRIDLLGVEKDNLPGLWTELGMPSGHAYGKSYRTCKSCVGTDFCRFGLGDSTRLAIQIEERFQGLESPGKMKLATAGCPRNCSEAMVKDLGAVAVEGGRWEIYVGGAAGAHVRKGDVLCVAESHDEVIRMMGRFIQYYRENARYLERSYSFVERIGIERLRAVLVEDREGIAAGLEQALEASISDYRDPWLEAGRPVTANQFATLLPKGASGEAARAR